MKKKWLLVCLLASLFVVTGCGKKDMSNNEISNNGGNEEVKENNNSKTEALAGLYPGADKLVEIPMGTYSDSGQKDYCTVRVPSNYWSSAVAHLSASNQEGFKMSGGTDLVSDAMSNGLLEQDNSIAYLSISSGFLESGTAWITFQVLTEEQGTYERFKSTFTDFVEIGTTENPAIYFKGDGKTPGYGSGDVVLAYYVNSEIVLHIIYKGSLYDELGIQKVAENLYNIVKVIK